MVTGGTGVAIYLDLLVCVGGNLTQIRVTDNHYGLDGMNGPILNLVARRTMSDH